MLNSQALAKLLRDAVRDADLRPSQLAERCGVTRQAVNGWMRDGRVAKRHLQRIAEVTNKPLTYFLGGHDSTAVELSPDEWQVVQKFRSSSEEGRTFIKAAADAAAMAHPLSLRKRI